MLSQRYLLRKWFEKIMQGSITCHNTISCSSKTSLFSFDKSFSAPQILINPCKTTFSCFWCSNTVVILLVIHGAQYWPAPQNFCCHSEPQHPFSFVLRNPVKVLLLSSPLVLSFVHSCAQQEWTIVTVSVKLALTCVHGLSSFCHPEPNYETPFNFHTCQSNFSHTKVNDVTTWMSPATTP